MSYEMKDKAILVNHTVGVVAVHVYRNKRRKENKVGVVQRTWNTSHSGYPYPGTEIRNPKYEVVKYDYSTGYHHSYPRVLYDTKEAALDVLLAQLS